MSRRLSAPIVFSLALIAGLLIGAAPARGQIYIVAYNNIWQDGDSVSAYVGTGLWFNWWCDSYPYSQCAWWYEPHVMQSTLDRDNTWVDGDYASGYNYPVGVFLSDEVPPGEHWYHAEGSHYVLFSYEYWEAGEWYFDDDEAYSSEGLLAIGPGEEPSISISGSQYVDDGGTGYFNVTAQGGTPTAYQWWFMNYEVAGNSPNVNFSPPNSTPTLTDAHWYAYPNDQCLAQKEAYYEVDANVWFGSLQLTTSTTHLYVNAGPDKGGETFVPQILGFPALGLVDGAYRVISVDNPYVLGTAPKFVYVQPSSQFYYKADEHENVHVSQWQPGGYLRNNGVFDLEYFWNQVKGMTAPTWLALLTNILQAQNTFWSSNAILALVYRDGAEAEAYAYSDTLDPMYFYQNCGRY